MRLAATLIVVFQCLLSLSAWAQTQKPDSSFCLEVRGRITLPKGASGSYKARLYWNGHMIDSAAVKKTGKPFSFYLSRDKVYGLLIVKKGYVQRLITIDTRISEADSNIYLFDFETTLIKKSVSRKLDKDALDYPIAIVAYDDRMIGFYFDEEYTSGIKRDIYRRNLGTSFTLRKM